MSLDPEFQLLVERRVNEENFLYAEYIKRHVEEYADDDDRKWILKNWNYPLIDKTNDIYKIQNYIRQFFIQYENILKNNLTMNFYDLTEIFDKNKLSEWCDTAYNLSIKYGLSIADSIYPFDMKDVLERVVDNNFIFKETIFFDEKSPEKIRGFSSFYDQKKKNLVLSIDIASDILDVEKLLTDISIPVILLRDSFGYAISQFEKDLLTKFSKTDMSAHYRSSPNLLYSRAVGLFAWDKIKIDKWNIDEVKDYLYSNNLILRKNKKRLKYYICNEECVRCNEKESCRRFFADSFRFAAFSIKEKRIVPSSVSGSVKNLSFTDNIFDRVVYG